jgi:hypothetical protein
MNKFVLGHEPTAEDIHSAKLHLEFFGGSVNNILREEAGGPLKEGYVADSPVMQSVSKFFEAEGWAYAGSGYFSAVYVKRGLAIKVGFKKEDSGATYAAWARANQGHPGVPVIHAIDKFKDCYVVLMDRCYPVSTVKHIHPAGSPLWAERDLIRDVIEHGDEPMAQFPATLTAAMIRAFFDGIAHFDANEGNLMLDRFGSLVITDPVSFDHGQRSNHAEGYYDYMYDSAPTVVAYHMVQGAIPAFMIPLS